MRVSARNLEMSAWGGNSSLWLKLHGQGEVDWRGLRERNGRSHGIRNK